MKNFEKHSAEMRLSQKNKQLKLKEKEKVRELKRDLKLKQQKKRLKTLAEQQKQKEQKNFCNRLQKTHKIWTPPEIKSLEKSSCDSWVRAELYNGYGLPRCGRVAPHYACESEYEGYEAV